MDVKKIGEAIRFLRIKEGYTQQDIADYLNISFQAVSKWERGLCVPDAMYLSKLAEHLNVDLDDLLEGNITYLEDEWRGVLLLDGISEFRCHEILQMCDIFLSYFMLAGIRKIGILSNSKVNTDLKEKYKDGSKWGIQIEYLEDPNKMDVRCNVMLVAAPVFMYGTNLTKYFWRAMNRKDGVSVLTVETEKPKNDYRVSYDKQHLIKSIHSGNYSALPVLFIPHSFFYLLSKGINSLIEEELLFAEPTARGMISEVINSDKDLNKALQLKSLVESMTGEKMYDLNEIAEARRLKQYSEKEIEVDVSNYAN